MTSNTATHDVEADRRRLINVAYRLLGSVADAEDAVQEAYIRWYALTPESREAIETPTAWLTTVTSRICLDQLGSARARRERYVGQWLPEPVPDRTEWASADAGVDPAERITLDESIDMAFLVVLDSMSPAERVAFLLHDVFRYPFDEVAEIVGRTPAACRQLASTARRKVRDTRPVAAPSARRAEVVREFKQAWEAMDIEALLGILDPDVVAVADGGGRVAAALAPIEGPEIIAEFMVSLARRSTDLRIEERAVNGQPGLVARQDDETITVFAFDVADGRITRIWAVRNPDKLRQWNA
ncbi:MAG TPA: RNA polymerase sigma factor SigJ [Nocardioides sp.]|uniref:RNA polymerase sigma factor SigJ n=1 Tax=Nocardioides sp. TaxID=35761 RepID=UPI002E354076|nr:RNA polymerase sigma factor SigJ [Nocardioides sp.]HEX5087566.1 RNA polymerase sigma factor SigJ [Nocardioides sp.]